MVSFENALQIITNSAKPLPAEDVALDCALGRFLSRDIYSKVTLPQYNAAFKDGFAVRFEDVAGADAKNPVYLKITGESFAGGPLQTGVLATLGACKITTGAYLPKGFDTVIPWEDCSQSENEIIVSQPPRKQQDIMPAGQDLCAGEPLLYKGLGLKPADIGLAAAAGHNELPVGRMPRVGIISTGDELVTPGQPLQDGQIYSSNQFQLKTQIQSMQMQAGAVIIPDNYEATLNGVLAMAEQSDVLISSGGSADSEKDFMGRVLNVVGWRLLVEKVNIKPGHTLRFGLLGNKPFFVLPGTPSGTEICFNIFVKPLLLKMAGAQNYNPNTVYARLLTKIKGWAKGKSIAQVVLSFEQAGPVVTPVDKNCGRIKSSARKNALLIVPEGGLQAGQAVEVMPMF